MPHPNFVPVRLSSSRNTHNSGVLVADLALTRLPLRLIVVMRVSFAVEVVGHTNDAPSWCGR
jgi:hypothetical protein